MAVVGLEKTFYELSEDVNMVTVCAIVYIPDIICPIQFDFNVTLSISDESTGIYKYLKLHIKRNDGYYAVATFCTLTQ